MIEEDSTLSPTISRDLQSPSAFNKSAETRGSCRPCKDIILVDALPAERSGSFHHLPSSVNGAVVRIRF